jgi:hypothetical protein
MLATYVLQFQMNLTKQNITTLLMGVVPTIILWYETLKIWRGRPK